VDQLALALTSPGIGHNRPPEAIEPTQGVNLRLTAIYADLLVRFRDLELACARVPDPILNEAAATAIDFIAQCQLHLKHALSPLERTCIRGNVATAFVRRSWTFEVIDLDRVPREYMSLDVPVVRSAITRDGIHYIPGLRIFRTEGLRVRATTSPGSHSAQSQRDQPVEPSRSAKTASDQRPRTPKPRPRIRSASDPRLVVPIKPIWGDQRVLRYYRQALVSLQPRDAAEIAKFRAANAAIEARLRRKLPHRMEEIEFLYGGSRGSPEAGEGTPK
jgi:hypothetical protein